MILKAIHQLKLVNNHLQMLLCRPQWLPPSVLPFIVIFRPIFLVIFFPNPRDFFIILQCLRKLFQCPDYKESFLILTSMSLNMIRSCSLKSRKLEEVGLCLQSNVSCPLDDFSHRLGYFSLFCGLILNQHISKQFFFFGMANKFVEVVRYPSKITAISGILLG